MKKKITRENIINIKKETDRIKELLIKINNYAEGYKNPLDELIYSKRELLFKKHIESLSRQVKELKSLNTHLRRIYKRDIGADNNN